MGIQIVSYTPDHVESVRDFNRRLIAGGARRQFFEHSEVRWIPQRPGQKVWREFLLAVDEGSTVRGAYCLKPQEFLVSGQARQVASWHGPLSEGIVDKKYSTVGFRLIHDLLKREPLFFSWGASEPLPQIFRSMGWFSLETPFCLRILRPFRFLRRNRYLRDTLERRLALDALAYTGAGWAGIKALQAGLGWRFGRLSRARAEEVPEFGSWADEVWKRSAGHYSLIAVRDADTMNILLPTDSELNAIRLRVIEGDQVIGWAVVLDNQLENDQRFGSMRVGTIVDFLAPPEDAHRVISAAFRFLEKRRVDMVCANLAHPDWIRGFAANGFVVLEKRRFFAISKALEKELEPIEANSSGIHITLMDGDGPRGFFGERNPTESDSDEARATS
jgi:hypothetical protein